jgi:hypothetical protein
MTTPKFLGLGYEGQAFILVKGYRSLRLAFWMASTNETNAVINEIVSSCSAGSSSSRARGRSPTSGRRLQVCSSTSSGSMRRKREPLGAVDLIQSGWWSWRRAFFQTGLLILGRLRLLIFCFAFLSRTACLGHSSRRFLLYDHRREIVHL